MIWDSVNTAIYTELQILPVPYVKDYIIYILYGEIILYTISYFCTIKYFTRYLDYISHYTVYTFGWMIVTDVLTCLQSPLYRYPSFTVIQNLSLENNMEYHNMDYQYHARRTYNLSGIKLRVQTRHDFAGTFSMYSLIDLLCKYGENILCRLFL